MIKHIPRKRFGQNFLTDRYIIADIIRAISPAYDDNVIEIGPGLGALTTPLLASLNHLQVIEIDRDIVAQLKERFLTDKLTIHSGDALRFDFGALGVDLRIIGNLPYNISTPILFHLAQYANVIKDITVMLQREVVERMVAEPGTSAYGRLSVMLQYRFELEKLIDVPPEAFQPAPKVNSALVRLVPRSATQMAVQDEVLFGKIVTGAFTQRRKTLRNALSGFLSELDFKKLNIDPMLRGERLAVVDYVRMANYLIMNDYK